MYCMTLRGMGVERVLRSNIRHLVQLDPVQPVEPTR